MPQPPSITLEQWNETEKQLFDAVGCSQSVVLAPTAEFTPRRSVAESSSAPTESSAQSAHEQPAEEVHRSESLESALGQV